MPTLDRPRIDYRTPVDLVTEVRRGLIRVPPFQRGFKWEASDVIALFDSILHGFPIGNLLFWRRPAPAGEVRVGPLQISAPEASQAFWVVDGQQRVTSLVGALAAAEESTDPRFRIYLDLETSAFHTLGARQQPARQWIPVSRLTATATLLGWIRENSQWMTPENIELADAAAQAIREYQIPTYIVTSDDEEMLRQIFDRLNGTGKPLSKAEVFHALHSGFVDDRPFDLRTIGAVPTTMNFGAFDERLALRCVLAYRGGDIFREDFSREFDSDEDRAATFHEVAACLRTVVEFLRGEAGIPHSKLLPYSHVVPVLVRFVKQHGELAGRPATLLRRWVWRDAIMGAEQRGVSVATVRQAIAAMDGRDSFDAADRLLRLASDRNGFVPDLSKVHLNHAAAKINVLGLVSVEPRDLRTGAPIDLSAIFDAGNPVRTLLSDGAPLADTFANRVVTGGTGSRALWRLLVSAAPEVADSHLIDRTGRRLLDTGARHEFLDHRSRLLTTTIRRHVNAMAEWGARDGRSLASMVRVAS